MSIVEIPMTFPLDADGFLRRECPNCKGQFKWFPTDGDRATTESLSDYHCPYCGRQAAADAWWTTEQAEHIANVATERLVMPMLGDVVGRVNRSLRGGGLMEVTLGTPRTTPARPLVESDDLVRVEFGCHPDEPLKIDPTLASEPACLVCGSRDSGRRCASPVKSDPIGDV